MEHSSWYHLPDPSAAPAHPHLHNATETPVPPPVIYQLPPFSAENSYLPHDYPPNPNAIPTWPDGAAPVSSHLVEAPTGGGAPQNPVVDAYTPYYYPPYPGYDGYIGHYGHSAVAPASDYHGLAGGGAPGFSAKEAIQMYGVDPGYYGNSLQAPPDFSMHQKKAVHTHYGPARKKFKKVGKIVQSAYCNVCKVDCNSQDVLISHRQGKKHKKNLEKLKESILPKPAKAPAAVAVVENRELPKAEEDKAANVQTEENKAQATGAVKGKTASRKKKKKSAPVIEMDLETKKRRLLEEGTKEGAMRVCTVCNIVCNSEVVFNFHIAGQKHAAMAKKQTTSAD